MNKYPLPSGSYNPPLDPVGTTLPKCPDCGKIMGALFHNKWTGVTKAWCGHGSKKRVDCYVLRKTQ